MFDLFIGIIIVLGVVLFIATVFMEWVGLVSVFEAHPPSRYEGCGHLQLIATSHRHICWRCRHDRLEHALSLRSHHLHSRP